MKYQLSFGRIPESKPASPCSDSRFRLAILADLSGRASRRELRIGESLAATVGRRVDVDNFEERLAQADLKLQLDIGPDGTCVDVPIHSLDDFHPDELYDNLDFFSELSGLRRRLQNSGTFEKAAQEVISWSSDAKPESSRRHSASTTVPRGKLSDFAQLMSREGAQTPAVASAEQLIQGVVAPFILPDVDPRQDELVAAVDSALADAMRKILHHPDFQSAESTWRTIDLLTRRLDAGTSLEMMLFDVSAEELAADLSATNDLTQTGLYQLLVVQPTLDAAQGPFAAIVGNYLFEQTPPHADLLARCAQIAASAGSPFLAGMSISSLERQISEKNNLCDSAWQGLREMPESVYLGLTTPRFLLRWPYGKKTEPIDPFEFEEFTPQTGLRGMLWGNAAMLGGLLLGQAFLRAEKISQMSLGELLSVDDLPYYYYTDRHGDVIALPCGERLVPEAEAMQISSMGCMPLVSLKNCPEVRLGGFRSVLGKDLAGPWAPVPITSPTVFSAPEAEEPPQVTRAEADDGSAVAEATLATPDADAEGIGTNSSTELSEPEPEPQVSASIAADELDDEPQPVPDADVAVQETATPSSESEVDDELDALLAELDEDESPSDDDEMDPELAKLLEGL